MKKSICCMLILAILLAALPVQASSLSTFELFADTSAVINGIAAQDGLIIITSDLGEYVVTDPDDNYYMRTEAFPKSMTEFENMAGSFNTGVIHGDDGLYIAFYAQIVEDEDFDNAYIEATLHKIEPVGNGRLKSVAQWALDWDTVLEVLGPIGIHEQLTNACVTNGMLVGSIGGRLAIFDIEKGNCELISTLASPLCTYKDGTILMQESLFDAPDAPFIITAYDPKRDRSEDLFSLTSSNYMTLGSAAYHEPSDTIYCTLNGELLSITGTDDEEPASLGPVSSAFGCSEYIAALSEGSCIFACERIMSVHDAGAVSAGTEFTVFDDMYSGYTESNLAKQEFRKLYPDVMRRDINNIDSIGSEILTQSSAVDVFVLEASEYDYHVLRERGMLLPLDASEEICALVDGAYPAIQNMVTYEGSIVAVPLYIDSSYPISYSPAAADELGISAEELPGTWLEFLRFLQTLPEIIADNGIITAFKNGRDIEGTRQEILVYMYQDYMQYLYITNQPIVFDTPMMRELIGEFEKIDFAALGLSQEREYLSQDPDTYLLNTNYPVSPDAITFHSNTHKPLPLSADETAAPILHSSLKLAFVNPYSENQEMAMAYLSLLAETLPDISVYSLSPGLNEAVRSSEYDYWHDLHVQRISEIEAEMKKAEEPELTQWKNTLEIWQCQLDDIENGATDRGWTMSEGSIASYRSHAENLNVDSGYGLSQDAFRVITGLFDQYNDGLLSADELLADVDERINMMLLEAK